MDRVARRARRALARLRCARFAHADVSRRPGHARGRCFGRSGRRARRRDADRLHRRERRRRRAVLRAGMALASARVEREVPAPRLPPDAAARREPGAGAAGGSGATLRKGSGFAGSAGFAATIATAGAGSGASSSEGSALAPAITTVTTAIAPVQKRLSSAMRFPVSAAGHRVAAAMRRACARVAAFVGPILERQSLRGPRGDHRLVLAPARAADMPAAPMHERARHAYVETARPGGRGRSPRGDVP